MIDGVLIQSLQVNDDQRGSFSEVFRGEWLPDGFEARQMNRSVSKVGALRGLHYHKYQTDYWFLAEGLIEAGLFDMRQRSPTYGEVRRILLPPNGVYIPPGVAHGYLALEDSVLIYVVDRYYNPSDDLSLKWDSVGIDWGIKEPILSKRDADAPTWAQLKEYNDHWNSPLPVDDPLRLYNL